MDPVSIKREILERDYKKVKQMYELSLVLLKELQESQISNEKRNEYTSWERQLKEALHELELTVTAEREKLNNSR